MSKMVLINASCADQAVDAVVNAAKNFVLELLEYDSFSDAFSVIYDWMEPQLWSDKEFVMEVLEKDCEAVIYVPDNLADDQEFRAFIDENVELAWVESHYPQDKIPQWIKDWTK